MSQFERLLNTVYGKLPGHSDISHFEVSFDHSSCSYGQPVLVLDSIGRIHHPELAGSSFGPGDIPVIQYSPHGPHYNSLVSAGFNVVDNETLKSE